MDDDRIDDDRLARALAYVDGELAPGDRAAFEREMAADPALAAEVARHRALAARVAATYDPVLDEPVPPGLTMAASVANDRGRWGPPQWGAIAASLLVGVLAGRVLLAPQASLAPTPDGLAARGALAQRLSTALAADPGPIRVGLTFRDGAGRYCRTFQSAPDRLEGLACRSAGDWRVEATAAWRPAAGPAYRTAGSAVSPAVLAAVDALRAGDVLDVAAERSARDAGWAPNPK